MPAPRIDTLRRQLAGMTELVNMLLPTLESLHELAYNRQAASERIRVGGGQPDYALDRHGDPQARAAYVALGELIDHVCGQIVTKAHPAVSLLNTFGDDGTSSGRRRPVSIQPIEHVMLIEAQARRVQRGEFDPGRVVHQPVAPKRTAAKRIQKLELEKAELTRRVQQLEQELRRRRPSPDEKITSKGE